MPNAFCKIGIFSIPEEMPSAFLRKNLRNANSERPRCGLFYVLGNFSLPEESQSDSSKDFPQESLFYMDFT